MYTDLLFRQGGGGDDPAFCGGGVVGERPHEFFGAEAVEYVHRDDRGYGVADDRLCGQGAAVRADTGVRADVPVVGATVPWGVAAAILCVCVANGGRALQAVPGEVSACSAAGAAAPDRAIYRRVAGVFEQGEEYDVQEVNTTRAASVISVVVMVWPMPG